MKTLATGMLLAALAAVPATAFQSGDKDQEPRTPTIAGRLMLFEQTNYNGDDYTITRDRTSVRTEWNIRSIAVHPGDSWQICAKPKYREPCITLTRGVTDASKIGIMGQIGSARISLKAE